MFYALLADLVVAIHFAYVAFVVVGQLVIVLGAVCRWEWIRNVWFRTAHLLAIGIVVFEAVLSYPCPLTTWENDLLRAAGAEVDSRTFVGRLLDSVLFYQAPQEEFGFLYYTFGALVLATFVLAPPRLSRRPKVSAAPILPAGPVADVPAACR